MLNFKQLFLDHTASYSLRPACFMEGDENAKLIVIGEYPTDQDVTFQKPFMSGSSKLLMNSLRSIGFTRADCYMTNVVKRHVSTKTPVGHAEWLLWKEALEYEISLVKNPKAILVLGNSPLTALLNFDGITKYRGSVYEYNSIPVIVANSPITIARMPENEIIFKMDIEKVKLVVNGDYKPHIIEKKINPTFQEAMDYMDEIQTVHKKFAMDIEVIGTETACIGLAHSANYAMCINFRKQFEQMYSVEEELAIRYRFAALCDDVTTVVIAQNGNFDSYFMGYKDHLRFTVDFDTLLAHHTLYPKLPHNLGFLTAQYTTHPYYKDDKDKYKEGGDLNSFWEYNATDCAITFAVAEKLEKELREQNLYDFFISHVMAAHPHLGVSTITGELVDVEKKRELHSILSQDLEGHIAKFQKTVQEAVGDTTLVINPNSPKQLSNLFYDLLGCQGQSRSTADPVREGWLKDPRVGHTVKECIVALNKYSEEHKFFSTYVKTAIDEDNRFRCEWKQFGVQNAPGRLSSSQTLWGSGGNGQNQPKRAYDMFIADPGTEYVYFDLAQAEARYVGWDANIEQWKHDFELARTTGNYDAHRALAASMFNVPYDETPKEDQLEDGAFTIRYIAKRCRHGLNYRMHIARLAQTTGLSLGEAGINYYIYHRTNPELKIWWDVLGKEVKKTHMLFNSYGRRMIFLERLDGDSALDSIVAFRPQSTIGDKVTRVWRQCHNDPRWDHSRARIFRNVHDALWCMSVPSFRETAMSIMKLYAEEPIMVNSIVTKKTEPMIIPADFKISDTSNGKPLHMNNMKKAYIEAAKAL